jgi:hypothetical protein
MKQDLQEFLPIFDRGIQNYIKWRSCSLLSVGIGGQQTWKEYEEQWYSQMVKIVNKKDNSQRYVREFEG